MIGLPEKTTINKRLTKKDLYQALDLNSGQRNSFDTDINTMTIAHQISKQTIPAITDGEEVKAIFVLDIELKRCEYDERNIALIAKLIPQRILFALHFEEKVQLAIYHTKLFCGAWQNEDQVSVQLSGLNLDTVWENIVASIGRVEVEQGNTLNEQIVVDEQREKIRRKIAALEKQMNSTKQPRRQRELFLEIKKLKGKSL